MNAVNARKTHCDKGHAFTEENTIHSPEGWRACKACAREAQRKSAAARRARERAARKVPPVIFGLPLAIWSKLEIRDCGHETPCLVWTGTLDSEGYGVVTIKGHQHRLHRLIYEAVNGPMPKKDENGKRIVSDHLCRNHACAAPDHIDPVTDGINVMRGISFAPANAAKTHCDNGHEFTPENTRIDEKGRRGCLECRRAGDRRRYAEQRAREEAEGRGRQRREARAKPEPKPVKLAPCGTLSAHTRHVRRKEPIDQACRDVHAARMRELRAERARVTPPDPETACTEGKRS